MFDKRIDLIAPLMHQSFKKRRWKEFLGISVG